MTFTYVEPQTVRAATRLLAENPDAVVLAGGVSLTLEWRHSGALPPLVVGIRRIPDLDRVSVLDGHIWLGARSTHSDIAHSKQIRQSCPALTAAFEAVGTVRIRNQGTLGGNLVHGDPGHDPPPALLALDATVVVASPSGERRVVPLDGFYLGHRQTILQAGDLVLGVRVPIPEPGARTEFLKAQPASAADTGVLCAAVRVTAHAGRVTDAAVALGGLAPTALRARSVEAALLGRELTAHDLEVAANTVVADIDPTADRHGSAEYKRRIAKVWVHRALREAAGLERYPAWKA